jgi:RNA polymerase-binding transcription factor DksA
VSLLLWVFQFAFGCHHNKLSSVLTIKKRTYQVCIECGQEFPYSWELMRPVPSTVANAIGMKKRVLSPVRL